jgi:ferritin
MKFEFSELIHEAVKLELNVSELYLVFHTAFKEDSGFWWKLAIEEKSHAALLKNLESFSTQLSQLPKNISGICLSDLRETNQRLEQLIPAYKKMAPSRVEAFKLAYELEHSAGESHFQEFADDESGSQISKIFKQLNQSDVNHARRIREYMEAHDMEVQ